LTSCLDWPSGSPLAGRRSSCRPTTPREKEDGLIPGENKPNAEQIIQGGQAQISADARADFDKRPSNTRRCALGPEGPRLLRDAYCLAALSKSARASR